MCFFPYNLGHPPIYPAPINPFALEFQGRIAGAFRTIMRVSNITGELVSIEHIQVYGGYFNALESSLMEYIQTPEWIGPRNNPRYPWPRIHRIPEEQAKPEKKVLQKFEGVLERVSGDKAYVTLLDEEGRKLNAVCDVEEFERKRIFEGTEFVCSVIKEGKNISIEIEKAPPKKPFKLDKKIKKKIDSMVSNYPKLENDV